MIRVTLALCLAVACSACSPGPTPPDGGGGGGGSTGGGGGSDAFIEIGTGSSSFVPLTDGQNVDIIQGPQGGYHIWGAVRSGPSLNPNGMEIRYWVLRPDGGEISLNGQRVTLEQNGAFYEFYGMLGVIPTPMLGEVQNAPTVLKMEASDAAGKKASDSRRVIPKGP